MDNINCITEICHNQEDKLKTNTNPMWFTQNYLENVLKLHINSSVKLQSFKKNAATQKGENYASAMYIINAEYYDEKKEPETLERISFIVKAQLENELLKEIEEDFNIFARESQVYKVIMFECEKELRKINDATCFGPRPIFIGKGVIFQENLKEKGYEICDIKKGLDYKYCQMAIRKLAKFHASSVIVYEKNPKYFVHHMPGNLTENENPLHDLYRNMIASCIEFTKTKPELQKYTERLENFSKEIIKSVCQTFTRNSVENAFYVLNHGDLWCNNLMYKTNVQNGNVEDVLMVDYQEGYFGSLGIDWNYFMYSSWHKYVFIHQKNELIKEYHNVLTEILTELQYDGNVPTLSDVQNEIRIKNKHGLVTATCLLPILISEHQNLADPENFISNTDEAKTNRLIIMNNPKYIELLQIFLDDFIANGVL